MVRKRLDNTDKIILMTLQEDSRVPLKKIAQKANVSIDTIHKRMKELREEGFIHLSGRIDPRMIGYPLIADVKIRLKDLNEEKKQEFINYLIKHRRCTDILEIMGQYDLTCVFVAKDSEDLANISNEVRFKYREIIDEWMSVLVLKTHKFDWQML